MQAPPLKNKENKWIKADTFADYLAEGEQEQSLENVTLKELETTIPPVTTKEVRNAINKQSARIRPNPWSSSTISIKGGCC